MVRMTVIPDAVLPAAIATSATATSMATVPPVPPTPYFQRHIFFCLNERKAGEDSCARHDAQAGFERCKQRVKQAGLAGAGRVRVNKSGCLDRCAGGPVAVVYPEGVWYSFVDTDDIDEIVDSHLQQGVVVERLRLPADVGR